MRNRGRNARPLRYLKSDNLALVGKDKGDWTDAILRQGLVEQSPDAIFFFAQLDHKLLHKLEMLLSSLVAPGQ